MVNVIITRKTWTNRNSNGWKSFYWQLIALALKCKKSEWKIYWLRLFNIRLSASIGSVIPGRTELTHLVSSPYFFLFFPFFLLFFFLFAIYLPFFVRVFLFFLLLIFFSFVFCFILSCELIPSWVFTLSFLLLYFNNNFIAVRFSTSSAAHLAPVSKGEKNSIFWRDFCYYFFHLFPHLVF